MAIVGWYKILHKKKTVKNSKIKQNKESKLHEWQKCIAAGAFVKHTTNDEWLMNQTKQQMFH